MNLRSNALALSVFSDRMLRIGMYLPFAAFLVFLLLSVYSQLFHGFSFAEISTPSLSIFQNQRAFMIGHGWVRGLNVDFVVLEAFIVIASTVGLIRLLTGFFSVRVLDSYRAKFEIYEKQGRSPVSILVFVFLVAPVGVFGSLNFEFASHSDQMRALMEYSPRSFLCLMTIVFCGGAMLIVEGLLLLTWGVFLSD
jgi:hypothetical protein